MLIFLAFCSMLYWGYLIGKAVSGRAETEPSYKPVSDRTINLILTPIIYTMVYGGAAFIAVVIWAFTYRS
jgi:hypothetical protein